MTTDPHIRYVKISDLKARAANALTNMGENVYVLVDAEDKPLAILMSYDHFRAAADPHDFTDDPETFELPEVPDATV
jgi:hypothetical protein